MTIEDIRAYLKEHEGEDDVKAFISELTPDVKPEAIIDFLNTDEGKKLIATHPETDRRVNEGVETFSKKERAKIELEIKKRVADELVKANPQETPEQKQLREMKQEFEAEKAARLKTEMVAQLQDYAREQKTDISKIMKSGWIPPSLEEGKLFIQQFASEVAEIRKQAVNETIAANAHKPGSGQNNDRPQIDTSKLTLDQAIELEMAGKLNDQLRGRSA